jgi:uncharacterized membrane protein
MTKSRAPAGPNENPKPGFDMEMLIGYFLLVGVLLSAALILAGIIWHGLAFGNLQFEFALPRMNLFEFVVADFRRVRSGVDPRLLLNLGLAVLMLVPYGRVAASIVYFAGVERDWKYTLFTGLVWAVLTYSLFLR